MSEFVRNKEPRLRIAPPPLPNADVAWFCARTEFATARLPEFKIAPPSAKLPPRNERFEIISELPAGTVKKRRLDAASERETVKFVLPGPTISRLPFTCGSAEAK